MGGEMPELTGGHHLNLNSSLFYVDRELSREAAVFRSQLRLNIPVSSLDVR